MFKRIVKIIGVIALAVGLAACGQRVEVPSAHVGKILTKDGYKPDFKPASKFRLDPCIAYCDEIVLLNVSDQAVVEPMTLFMPLDKLNMQFELMATLSVKEGNYDDMYARLSPENVNGTRFIPINKVYATYAQQIIRAEAREFLSQYSISDIASNLEAVNAELSRKLTESIVKRTPFSVRYIGLSNLQYPKIIVDAQENAAKRTEMIRQEQAQLELSKVSLERELQEQKMQRTIDVEKAEAEAQVNKILADSITPNYVKYRELFVMEKIADSDNKVFVPTRMLDSIAGQVSLGRQ